MPCTVVAALPPVSRKTGGPVRGRRTGCFTWNHASPPGGLVPGPLLVGSGERGSRQAASRGTACVPCSLGSEEHPEQDGVWRTPPGHGARMAAGTPSSLLVATRPAEPERGAVDPRGVGVPPRGTSGSSSSAGSWSWASWPAPYAGATTGAAAAVGVRVRRGGGARWGSGALEERRRPRWLPPRRHRRAPSPRSGSGGLPEWRRVRGPAPPSSADRGRPVPSRASSAPSCAGRRHRFADPVVSGQPSLRPRCAVRAAVPTLEAGLRSPAAVVRPTAAPGSGCSDAGPPVRGCISVPAVLPGPPARGSIGGAAPRIAAGPPVRCPGARSRRDRARGRGWPRSRTPSRRPPASSAPIASRARRAGRRGGHRDPEVGRYGDVSRGTGGVSRASRTGTVTGVWARSARR